MSNKVRVSIYGNSYTIQGDASPDYIDSLSRYVSLKMDEVSRTMPSANTVQVAILAALNIADEYFQLKDMQTTDVAEIEKKTDMLISMLEDGIIGDIFQKAKAGSVPRAR